MLGQLERDEVHTFSAMKTVPALCYDHAVQLLLESCYWIRSCDSIMTLVPLFDQITVLLLHK